ncbi:YicC/YloC family endoribonuclease [Pseudoflavonifractor phocaeensis]|uniref:YicC/YloC family endoribonuclease n=1 Tax=Oscillospiraceae TaxID=216572 RepID=UPI001FAF6435|nr:MULTISPECIES: YicC/YloC family endoribonuclease [Oscillospiraceae]
MIKSMTGYGRGEAVLHGRPITVEVRSVNNRYLDCTVKLPRIYVFAEDAIKAAVQSHISRGKVDVFITIGPSESGDVSISVNRPVADGYYAALCALRDAYGLKDDISVSLMSRFQDVFLVEKTQEDLEAVSADICSVLELALRDFDAMRLREGEKLGQDVLSRAASIEGLVSKVEVRSPGIVADYRARLTAKMTEVLQNTQLDESRILTEAAIYADKVAVDEETVRLRSHLSQLRHLLQQEGAIGRKLDFLIQEFNREANTIGSKCNDIETAGYVVDIKAEIEKIREQIQNME